MQVRGNPKEWTGRFSVLLVSAILIFIQFTDWFQHPNRLAGLWNDALKNYAAPWYHVKYDSSYAAYQGMNYPFGDHINTVDGQPILSNTWKALSSLMPALENYYPAVSNMSILLSFLLGSFFMYLLFRAFRLPVWLSVTLSVFVTFLSPQTLRVVSHYGLAHLAAIPAALYFLLRFWQRPSLTGSFILAGIVLFYALIHLYFLAVLGGLIGAFHLVEWLRKPDWKNGLRFLQRIGIQLFLPAAALLSWMEWTDPIAHRNAFPFGFFAYRAYPEGLFTSPFMPYFQWLEKYIVDIRDMDFEAWNYVGLVMGVMFFALLLGLIRRRMKSLPFLPETLENRDFLNVLFIALLLNLLFALGLPFTIPGLEPLLDYAGPLRQFRSIGRFAWNCYYGWQLTGWVALYYWVENDFANRNMLRCAALALTAFEAIVLASSADVELQALPALENGRQLTELQINYDEFQAIQTVPHYNVGSGNFWWVPEGYIIHHSLMLGIRTGLPTTSSFLTRTSPEQSLQQLQLATPPYRMPSILEQFPDDRPLLLMWDKQQEPLSRQSYRHFLEDAELLFESQRMQLFRLPLASFRSRLERQVQRVRQAFTADTIYHRQGAFLSTDSLLNFSYASLDDGNTEAAYLGTGGLAGRYREFTQVYATRLPGMARDSQYVCSFWMFVQTPVSARMEIFLQEVHPPDGTLLQQTYAQAHQSIQLVDANGWALIEFPFTRKAGDSEYRLLLRNRDLRREDIYIDELLLRPASTNLYRRLDDGIWHNNHWWPEAMLNGKL